MRRAHFNQLACNLIFNSILPFRYDLVRPSSFASSKMEQEDKKGHVAALETQLQKHTELILKLESRLQDLEDKDRIRAVQHSYGYYIDKCLYPAVVDLFSNSPDASVHFLNGIWKGREGIARLYIDWFGTLFTGGKNGPPRGFLLDHLMMQDIITISPPADGQRRAKGRFRTFLQAGSHESIPEEDRPKGPPKQFWEGGIYENQYVFEDGKWKIFKLGYNMLWQAEYEKGWSGSEAHLALDKCWPDDKWGPDELVKAEGVWPETRIVPFHYLHPVTGAFVGGS